MLELGMVVDTTVPDLVICVNYRKFRLHQELSDQLHLPFC